MKIRLVALSSLLALALPHPSLAEITQLASASTGDAFVTLTRSALPAAQLPMNTDYVGPEDLRAYQTTQTSEILTRRTSVQSLPLGGLGSAATVRIRGASSPQTLVLIDGRPLTGYSLGPGNLTEIPVESIDHVEIVRGGLSSLYGPNAIGGVINVITRRGTDKPSIDAGMRFGSYGRQELRASAGAAWDGIRYFLYGSQQRESGFRQNADSLLHYGGGNLSLPLGVVGDLNVDASVYRGNVGVPGIVDPPIPTNQFDNEIEKVTSSPRARQETRLNSLRARHHVLLPMDSALTVRFSGLERETDYRDPDAAFSPIDSLRQEQSKGGDAELSLPYGFMVGGNFSRDQEDSRDRIDPVNSFIEHVEQWGVFVQENATWRALTVLASGRYDHHSKAGDSTNPRLQLIAEATPWLRVTGSAARSFRAPTLDDLYYRSTFFNGNPALRPEKAWTYDVGAEAHDPRGRIGISFFRADVTDLIQINPITFDTSVNVGKARRQGIEIQGEQAISEAWRQSVNYTYLDNKGIPSTYTDYVTLSYSPRHTANHVLTWQPTKAWTTDMITRWLDHRWSGNNQTGTKLGSQVTWDFRISRNLAATTFYVGVNDVLNKRYEEQAGFPLPGRTFFGGMDWKFMP